MLIIDPPVGPYSPVDDIEEWLDELNAMGNEDEVQEAIAEAEAWIKDQEDRHVADQ